jgi:DNA-binding beta-propeller fold protein YncE
MKQATMRASLLAGGLGLAAMLAASVQHGTLAAQPAAQYPVFEVDASWPQLPNNWVLGHVAGVATDRHDHIWLLHRPNVVPADQRSRAAPPVLEFDAQGRFVNAWGGPGQGFDWPDSEHGIVVDYKDRVWIGGSAPIAPSLRDLDDDMLLKFDNKGKFLLQFGGRNTSKGNTDTRSVHQPADVFVWPKTDEAFIADGYGNRRIIVLDAETARFKRMWGAYGNAPVEGVTPRPPPGTAVVLDTEGRGAEQFGSPVHAIKVSDDGLVYAADRPNRRVQVFTPEGRYVDQVFINRAGPAAQSAAGLALSPDPQQRFLYVADYGNSRIAVVERRSLTVLYQFGERTAKPGGFQGLHQIAIDSKGNLYTGEVAPGARAQRFLFKGLSPTLPPNALTAAAAATAPPAAPAVAAMGGPLAAPRAPATQPTRLLTTTMTNPYRMVLGWPHLGSIRPGAAIGILPDGSGGVWLQHRSVPAIVHLNSAGDIVKQFDVSFSSSHGLCRDSDGNFWAVDGGTFVDSADTGVRGNQVFKYSPDGKLLLTLGKAGVGKAGTDTFLNPSACAATPDGNIVIADGHWPRPSSMQQDGDRLVWFTRDGRFIKEFGRKGSKPGEFMGPHGLAFDSRGRLFVADRSNNRLQIFDKDMNFVDEWRHFGRPSGVVILKDDTLVVADSESSWAIAGPPDAPEGGGSVVRNPGWQNGIRIGSAKDGALHQFIPNTRPEGLGADDSGIVYSGLTGGCDASPSGGCLQKFIREYQR